MSFWKLLYTLSFCISLLNNSVLRGTPSNIASPFRDGERKMDWDPIQYLGYCTVCNSTNLNPSFNLMTQNFDTSPSKKKTVSPLKFFKARSLFILTWWVWVHNFIRSNFSLSYAAALLLALCLSFNPLSWQPQLTPINKSKEKTETYHLKPNPQTLTLSLFLCLQVCEVVSTLMEWRSLWSDTATD